MGRTDKTTSAPDNKRTSQEKEAGKETSFRLLDLPPEIRYEIYRLTTAIEPVGLTTILHCGVFHSNPRCFKVPALLHTSQQIRSEATPIFYSKTKFLSHFSATTLVCCLQLIGHDNLKLVRTIECRGHRSKLAARLWLQVVSDMLEMYGLTVRDDAVRAGYTATSAMPARSKKLEWLSLSQVQAWNREKREQKGKEAKQKAKGDGESGGSK